MSSIITLADRLMYSTVRIECYLQDGRGSTGTGFFFKFLENGESHVPVIITNKHVVEGAISGKFIMTLANEEGKPINTEHFPVQIDNLQAHCIYHPNPEVDLCAIPIASVLQQLKQMGKSCFFISLTKDIIPSEEQIESLSAIEDITMIGYPNGLWDRVNNLPIIRQGITASHPKFNHNGKEEFLIDAACFPGSSGSPVLILNQGSYTHGNNTVIGSRVYLLGILYAGPQFTATGEIMVMNVPTSPRPVPVSQIPMNLGYVIKINKLIELEEILRAMV